MKRPLGMTAVATVAIVLGVALVVASAGYLGITALQLHVVMGEFEALSTTQMYGLGVALALFGFASVVFGIGAIGMHRWAWLTGMLLFGLEIVAALVLLVMTQASVVAAAMGITGAIVFWYLSTYDVRAAFGLEAGTTGGHHPSPA
jgi:hypothetical protein